MSLCNYENGVTRRVNYSLSNQDSANVREALLEQICAWLGKTARKQPDRLNAIVLLRLLVEDLPEGVSGLEIERRLRKSKPWAKREILRLRETLDDFRTGAGAALPWRFDIETTTESRYRAVLKLNAPRLGPEAVWLPHVWSGYEGSKGRKNWFALTEPVSFRDPAGTFYVLHSSVNRPDPEMLFQQMEGLRDHVGSLKPCSHYVSFGDVLALRTIEQGLKEIREDALVACTTNQDKRWNELCSENFIFLGTWQENELIREFQETESRLLFAASGSSVRILGPLSAAELGFLKREGAREFNEHEGQRDYWELSDLPGRVYFGVFSRISDRVSRQVKSVIVSNHGPASEAIAQYLFSKQVEDELIPAMRSGGTWNGLPDNYQLLFRVSLAVGTERKGKAELLTFRVLEDAPPA